MKTTKRPTRARTMCDLPFCAAFAAKGSTKCAVHRKHPKFYPAAAEEIPAKKKWA